VILNNLIIVDPKLRVHGLLGLRVADASVMPRIITGPTNAPTGLLFAEKTTRIFADIQLCDHPFMF
jgi:choline dehydrogenase-like flavoprotein